VLCLDEVHERGRAILFATDPLLDATVGWKVVKQNDQASMDAFLDELKAAGFRPEVVITDGSLLYKESLTARWREVAHQLCIFHVLRDANRAILDAVCDLRKSLPQPRRYRRGRPCRRGRPRQQDDRRALITEHLHLVVKKAESWTEGDGQAWARLLKIDPRFELLRAFVERLYGCFQKGLTPQQARYRRTRLVSAPRFASDPHLRRVMVMLAPEKFEKMIVFLSHPQAERTNTTWSGTTALSGWCRRPVTAAGALTPSSWPSGCTSPAAGADTPSTSLLANPANGQPSPPGRGPPDATNLAII
jgi:hypothetical protein